MTPQITAVIPQWNRARLLERLLRELGDCPALVVDNGSTDDSVKVARGRGAVVLELGVNRGFAAAVNAGVQAAQTEWVAVLNNDVLLDPGFLQNLQQAAIRHRAAYACGLLYRQGPGNIVDGTYDLVSRAGCAWRAGSGSPVAAAAFPERSIVFAPFTAILLHRGTFLELGGLDERFGSYLEDVDFCLRAALAGNFGVFVPQASGIHEGSRTLGSWSPAMVRLLSRNQVYLVAKHLRRPKSWPVVAGQLLWGMLAIRHAAGTAWLLGKWEGIRTASQFQNRLPPDRAKDLLAASEVELQKLQAQIGFDWYWRWYFRLVGPVG